MDFFEAQFGIGEAQTGCFILGLAHHALLVQDFNALVVGVGFFIGGFSLPKAQVQFLFVETEQDLALLYFGSFFDRQFFK